MNTVDVIGAESVCKWIEQSKLTKFIIFRQGAMKGSTPVFRCDNTKNISQAKEAFTDWATSTLRMNPYNNLPYDMLLFSEKASESDIDDELDESKPKKNSPHRKIRFSFSLNPFNNIQGVGMGSPTDVKTAVQEALNQYKQEQRIAELEAKLAARDDDDDDDDDNSTEMQAITFLKELNKNKRLSLLEKGVKVSGDEDDEDDHTDDDEYFEEEEDTHQEDDEEKKPKKKISEAGSRLKNALLILKKGNPNYIRDLEKIALLKKKQPAMFNSYMKTLRNMKF